MLLFHLVQEGNLRECQEMQMFSNSFYLCFSTTFWGKSQNHRIIEFSSNPTLLQWRGGHHSQITLLRVLPRLTLKVSRDGESITSPGNLFQCLTTLIVKDFFLLSNLNLPSLSLKKISPCSLSTDSAKESVSFFPVAPLQILKGRSQFTTQPSLLQAEQPQLPQPVLTGEVFHSADHCCGPLLDTVQVRSHLHRVEGQDHLPQPTGHACFDAAQDLIGSVGCEGTLLAHVKFSIHQQPQVRCMVAQLMYVNSILSVKTA